MNSRSNVDVLLERVNQLLGHEPQATELAPGNEPVNFEELRPAALQAAMVWDIDTQVARFLEATSKLLWSPRPSAQDKQLLSDTIYARTALRVAGLNTVVN